MNIYLYSKLNFALTTILLAYGDYGLIEWGKNTYYKTPDKGEANIPREGSEK